MLKQIFKQKFHVSLEFSAHLSVLFDGIKMKTTIVEAEKQLCFCIYVINTVLIIFSLVFLYRNQCVHLHNKSID